MLQASKLQSHGSSFEAGALGITRQRGPRREQEQEAAFKTFVARGDSCWNWFSSRGGGHYFSY